MGKKKLSVKDVLEGYTNTPVEISIGARCEHECFDIVCSGAAIYRLAAMPAQHLKPATHVMIHACGDGAELNECLASCWGGEY